MFSSSRNWRLTLLIGALVALVMLVAWVYVIPHGQERATTQKLVDARTDARLISDTVGQCIAYDPSSGQLIVTDEGSLDRAVSTGATRAGGRVIVYTRDLVPRKDSSSQDPLDAADYPMLEQSADQGRVVQGTVTTERGRVAATAVPLYSAQSARIVVAVVLVISSL